MGCSETIELIEDYNDKVEIDIEAIRVNLTRYITYSTNDSVFYILENGSAYYNDTYLFTDKEIFRLMNYSIFRTSVNSRFRKEKIIG